MRRPSLISTCATSTANSKEISHLLSSNVPIYSSQSALFVAVSRTGAFATASHHMAAILVPGPIVETVAMAPR